MTERWQLQVVMAANSANVVKALSAVQKIATGVQASLLEIGQTATQTANHVGLAITTISAPIASLSYEGFKQAAASFDAFGKAVVNASLEIQKSLPQYQQLQDVITQTSVKAQELAQAMGQTAAHSKELGGGVNKSALETAKGVIGVVESILILNELYDLISGKNPLKSFFKYLRNNGPEVFKTTYKSLTDDLGRARTMFGSAGKWLGPVGSQLAGVWRAGTVMATTFGSQLAGAWRAGAGMATTFGGRLAGKDLLTPIRSLTPHWGETVLSVGKTVGKASKPAYGKAAASSLAPVLGKAVGQAGAIFAAWEIGKMIGNGLSDYVINPTVQWMTGNKNANLGTAIYEWTHPDPSQAPQASRIAKQPDINPQTLLPNKRPSLLEANTVRASGQIEVNFTNAPAGLRVAQTSKTKSDVPLNVYVGYNSFATGMP